MAKGACEEHLGGAEGTIMARMGGAHGGRRNAWGTEQKFQRRGSSEEVPKTKSRVGGLCARKITRARGIDFMKSYIEPESL